MESPRAGSGMSSPEAKLGMKVEDLWDVLITDPQLSPTEKMNACFESMPVSDFPPAPSSQVIEINSDASLGEAVLLLSQHKVLSAPVVDVDAPKDASWIDRYIGIVEFAGIVVWILHQTSDESDLLTGRWEATTGPAVAAACNRVSSPRKHEILSPKSAAITSGKFFETLTSSDFYKNTKVRDISGSFRWAPFLALQKSNSFLTMLLLLSKYRMKSIPVVDPGEGTINNIITQSAVIHMLEECSGLQWFESWGTKKLSELGLPLMKSGSILKVYEDEPVLQAFKLMRQKGVGGVPVIKNGGRKAVGNISIRDIQFLLIAPEIYKNYRSITAKNFLTAVKSYLEELKEPSPLLNGMLTCKSSNTIKEVIIMLDDMKVHRIYVVDDEGNLEGVEPTASAVVKPTSVVDPPTNIEPRGKSTRLAVGMTSTVVYRAEANSPAYKGCPVVNYGGKRVGETSGTKVDTTNSFKVLSEENSEDLSEEDPKTQGTYVQATPKRTRVPHTMPARCAATLVTRHAKGIVIREPGESIRRPIPSCVGKGKAKVGEIVEEDPVLNKDEPLLIDEFVLNKKQRNYLKKKARRKAKQEEKNMLDVH